MNFFFIDVFQHNNIVVTRELNLLQHKIIFSSFDKKLILLKHVRT